MAAECYWCATTSSVEPHPPLGTCSDCWVFACDTHAERDTANVGKWKCFDGVAKLLSAGAGFDDAVDEPDGAITTATELKLRFPRIATETESDREYWRERGDELIQAAARVDPERSAALEDGGEERRLLLADAVGVVHHYLPPRRSLMLEQREAPRVGGRVGRLVEEL
jgi:hypothetical protein